MSSDLRTVLAGGTNWLARRAIGPFRRRRRELAETQWWDADKLAKYQLSHLRAIARQAYQSVPFYRAHFARHNVDPDRIASLHDLDRLPALTKRDVRTAGGDLVSRGFPRWALRVAHTGGTTGLPLRITRDVWSIGNEHAFVRRQWEWAGLGLRDRCAFLTGRVIVPPDQTSGPLYRIDPIMRELVLSTYHLGLGVVREYADAMRTYKAAALVAYPSSALTFARGCRELGLRLPLRAVLTSSEVLSPEARHEISAAFECSVFDFYGSAERVCYIHCCERGRYHVVPEYGYTEFVPDPTHQGLFRIVATGFWNRAMPLFRYELGDLVEAGGPPCSCGRQFETVERIVGRPSECIVTPSGRQLGTALLSHLLYGPVHLLESQLVQDAPDHVSFRYIRGAGFGSGDLDALRRLTAQHLPSELQVEFVEVDEIPRTVSGKFRPIVGLAGQSDAGGA